jgi:hypothetical protein
MNHPGYGFEPTEGVVIDEPTVALLSSLHEEMKGVEPAWLAKVPASIRSMLKVWRDRTRPVVLIGIREEDPATAAVIKPPKVKAPPVDTEIDAQDVDDLEDPDPNDQGEDLGAGQDDGAGVTP